MDAQDVVLARYPHAEAMEEPPVFRHGESAPIDCGFWIIVADADGTTLGNGGSEEAAWNDAARKLKAADPLNRRRLPVVRLVAHSRHRRLARMLHLLG